MTVKKRAVAKKVAKAAKLRENVKSKRSPNTLFPGRPGYVGPQRGWFAMLHHQQLFERATCDVKSRVAYVKRTKPGDEVPVRLHNMMYLGNLSQIKALQMLHDACWEMRDYDHGITFDGYALRRPIEQAIEATKRHIRPLVIAYVKKYIPDHSWEEENNTITGT